MRSKTILIAYQDDLGTRSLSTFLHGRGYKVETTKTMSEVIRRIRKGNIDVMLIDDEIEGVRACDLVSLFKKMNHRVQVIVISSEESIGGVKRLRGAGIFSCWRLGLILGYSVLFTAVTRPRELQSTLIYFLKPIPLIPERRIGLMVSLTLLGDKGLSDFSHSDIFFDVADISLGVPKATVI